MENSINEFTEAHYDDIAQGTMGGGWGYGNQYNPGRRTLPGRKLPTSAFGPLNNNGTWDKVHYHNL